MKTPGIIGGIGPESTIEYYRLIIAAYRERKPDGSYPNILINSIDLNAMPPVAELVARSAATSVSSLFSMRTTLFCKGLAAAA